MQLFLSYWPWLTAVAAFALHVVVSAHIIFHKRDSRAAAGWIALVWFSPFLGSLGYFLLGINRIERRARRVRHQGHVPRPITDATGALPVARLPALPSEAAHFRHFAQLSETVTGQPLCEGNAIQPLADGDQAYPVMLQAIEDAQHAIGLSMYIFDNDRTGHRFAEALGRAVARGVAVRVLIDDVGARHLFSWRSISGPLRRAGVPTARFLPTIWPRSIGYANLRNHRKLMIVDGRIGFTGGMNISDGCWLSLQPSAPFHDLQFRIEGPVVARMQEIFAEDWTFTTGEPLDGERWFPQLEPRGTMLARGVSSSPGEDLEKLRLVLLGALTSARSHVVIVTPYFLPDADLIAVLNITALRGVQVDVLLPLDNDFLLVRWAEMGQFAQMLEYGCRIWTVPGPFIHTKLMLIDGVWTMFGSANWDTRSLRLNFEFNIECYDRALAASLEVSLEQSFAKAEPLTLAKLKARSFLVKLRDGAARLLLPYL